MPRLTALSLVLVLFVSLVVGLRLLWMARRTGELPELLFGIVFTTSAIGSAGGQLGQRLLWDEPGVLATVLNATGFGLVLIGTCLLYTVVWQVFRPDRTWAAALAIAGSGMALLGYAIRALTGDFSTMTVESPGMAIFQGSRIVLFGWWAMESFRYSSLLRRRVRLGLAAPVSALQILLFGVSGLAMMVFTATVVSAIFVQHVHPLEVPSAVVLTTVASLSAAVCMWCAFFPPFALRRLVAGAEETHPT
jgi:hypothetical protein